MKSKKGLLAKLIALSLLSATSMLSINTQINGYTTYHEADKSNEDSELKDKIPDEIKQEIIERLSKDEIVLDSQFSDYISSINLDGNTINIELFDGEVISRDIRLDKSNVLSDLFGIYTEQENKEEVPQTIILKDLILKKFYVQDREEIKKQMNTSLVNGTSIIFERLMSGRTELTLDNIEVKDEIKISGMTPYRLKSSSKFDSDKWKSELNLSKCRKIWFCGIDIDNADLKKFSNNPNLQMLYLSMCPMKMEKFSLKAKEIETLCIEPLVGESNIKEVELQCPKVKTLSVGAGTYLQNLNFLKDLNIKNLSFGDYSIKQMYDDMLLTFEEKEKSVGELSTDLNKSYYGSGRYSLIEDLSAIEGSDLERISIIALNHITAEDLLKLVKTLPHLKEIKGLAINNAMLYSDELVLYCEEHNIKHPFNEKSKEIRNEISRIIDEIITPDMSDKEKIKTITEYVINNMEYYFDAINNESTDKDIIKRTWGEKLWYSLFEHYGVCDGYEALTHALLQEAGIKAFKQNGPAHTWVLIQLDDGYYQLDTTKLDYLLDSMNKHDTEQFDDDFEKKFIKEYPDGYDFSSKADEDKVPYYMVRPGSPDYQDSYLSPEDVKTSEITPISRIFNSITKGILEFADCICFDTICELHNNEIPKVCCGEILNRFYECWSISDLKTLKESVIDTQSISTDKIYTWGGDR